MLDNGTDLRHTQEMLGHTSKLTTQLYKHISRKKLTEMYEGTHLSAQRGSELFYLFKAVLTKVSCVEPTREISCGEKSLRSCLIL
jgi:hypothetical protein